MSTRANFMTPFVSIDVRVFDDRQNIRIVLRSKHPRHPNDKPLTILVDRDVILDPGVHPRAEHRFEAANDNHPTSPDEVAR